MLYIFILSCGFPSVLIPQERPPKDQISNTNPGRGSKRQTTYVNFQLIIINMFIMFWSIFWECWSKFTTIIR